MDSSKETKTKGGKNSNNETTTKEDKKDSNEEAKGDKKYAIISISREIPSRQILIE